MGPKRLNSSEKKRVSKGNENDENDDYELQYQSFRVSEHPPGPFSTALKMVKERKFRLGKQLIDWKRLNNGRNAFRPPVPSLLDLSLLALAKNADAMVSLAHVPDFLRGKLADMICVLKKMDFHIFELFVRGSPTQIRIKDCSWLKRRQLVETCRNLDTKDLMMLQLDRCEQFAPINVISKTLDQFSKSFPNLGVLSLKGARHLSSNRLKAFVTLAPALQSINLSSCTLLTNDGINILAESLGSMLRELYIGYCPKIDAMLILPELKKFEYLEVLSVAGMQTVSDRFVYRLLTACGHRIKELNFADCLDLTDDFLKVIGKNCTSLLSLNISYLYDLTDRGLAYLSDGCRCIEKLVLYGNEFSDDAIAAFVEASGESLKELSIEMVKSVGPCTAFSLAKCSKKLLVLTLSWCHNMTDEALGLIVDSCMSLKLVILNGCTQITNVFVNGHSNPQVHILGLRRLRIKPHQISSLLELYPSDTLLRYSAIKLSSDTTETENPSSSLT